MKIAVGGSSGLVGSALCKQLAAAGHDVTKLVRQGRDGIRWDARTYAFESPDALSGYDAVVHLGGESIVGRWTKAKKERILHSRIDSTHALATHLAQLADKPRTLILASAIGYYGNRGAEELTEETISGSGFLSDVCRAWEEAADPARDAGLRVVHLRFGMVLSPAGGALKAMLPAFRMGVGGRIGDGRHYMSWITLNDTVRVITHALHEEQLAGPVNVVTPTPCTNTVFTQALGSALNRPTLFPVPAFAVRLLFGEMGSALLLASQRVYPRKLEATGFAFQDTDLHTALKALLNRPT